MATCCAALAAAALVVAALAPLPSTAAADAGDLGRAPAAEQPVRAGQSATSKSPAGRAASGAASRATTTCGGVGIGPGLSPAGYLGLANFGITPIAGVGDETLTTFNVPSFRFSGQTWTQLVLSSNGYLQVGGDGTNSFVNQNLPDPAAPNNTLAAFWTDLNPGAGGALRIGTLTDGLDQWIVAEWENVPEFSDVSNTHSFQIWIGVDGDANPAQDISYAYGANTGNGDGGFLTVGAENATGTSGGTTYYNGSGTLPTLGTELVVTNTGGGPVADFTATPTSGAAPLNVDFDASASTDDGSIVSYDWDFGDGTSGSGVATDHDYAAGVYTARLTVTDDAGNTCSAAEQITAAGGFSVDDVTVDESAGTATFTVSRPGGSAATVDVAAVAGSARTPADFSATPATLSFAAGETSKTFDVSIAQDALDEFTEGYTVRLTNPVGGSVVDGTGRGRIRDDDPLAALSVGDANVVEGDTGTRTMSFRVTLSRSSGKRVEVTVYTANGSAVAPYDYYSRTVRIAFTPGQTSRSVGVSVVGDRRDEPNETFFVLLNNASNAVIADPNGSGGIIDND